ncbi:MAG: hypothetical protein PHP01_02960 [Phycisphaerae bacterium]|nr:hypothetical protein [Phycisphaerae bacterium]
MVNCVFVDNTATVTGGGLYIAISANPTIINCIFSGNYAGGTGDYDGGGGIGNVRGEPIVKNTVFCGNQAVYRGGGVMNRSIYEIHPDFINCVFFGNHSSNGGGMANVGPQGTDAEIINCTFSKNQANNGGALYNYVNVDLTIRNSIIWDNIGNYGKNIYNGRNFFDSDPTLTSSCMNGGLNASPWVYNVIEDGIDLCRIQDGGGNTYDNPNFPTGSDGVWTSGAIYNSSTCQSVLTNTNSSWITNELVGNFINPDTSQCKHFYIVSNTATTIIVWGDITSIAHGNDYYQIFDYNLTSNSTNCIDAGDNNIISESYDIAGNIRKIDGNGDQTVTVDIGAYEYAP